MRRKAKNPFPGVCRVVDRHDKVRWRFRKKGLASTYLSGEYGSAEFRAAYEAALSGGAAAAPSVRHDYGTFDWLIEHYKRTPRWQKLRETTRYNLSKALDRFSRDYGKRRVALLHAEHIEAILAKKSTTPAAANGLLKLFGRLCRFAIRKKLITVDPTVGIERYGENPDGFHTWTDAEILQFEDFHASDAKGADRKAILALRLILNTGAARQDVVRLGRQNVSSGRISYRRGKTGGEVDLPILDELAEVLATVPANRLIFVTHSGDHPYKPTTFGNWFHDCCVAAGLPAGRAPHGLRKAGATRLGNAGATELELMAFLGHKTPNEARTYVKKFDRKRLGDSGMEKVARAKREQNLSNPIERLDKFRANTLKEKG